MPTEPGNVILLPVLHGAGYAENVRPVAFHSHPHRELILQLSGEIGVDIGPQYFSGPPGTLYIMPAKIPHNQRGEGHWRTLCVLFSQARPLLSEEPSILDVGSDAVLRRWLEDLAALYAVQGNEATCTGLLFCVLTRIGELERRRWTAQALHPRLALAMQYLHEHVLEEFDARRLAAVACASYSHLSALFRRQFGCGPLKYQQDLRLDHAGKLLQNPYLSIGDVARQTGYASTNYFVRLFRQRHGVPPGQWRKERGSEYCGAGAPPAAEKGRRDA